MHGKRTEAWWWSRILLAIAIVLVLLAARLALEALEPVFDPEESVALWEPIHVALVLGPVITALPVAIIGLVWMIRILRGPRDEPPPWRYRGDR